MKRIILTLMLLVAATVAICAQDVQEQTDIRYGDEVIKTEITGVKYLTEDGADILRVDVRHILRTPSDLSPERQEQWNALGIQDKKYDFYDYSLEG